MSVADEYEDIETRLTIEHILRAVRAGVIVNDVGPDGEPLRVAKHSEDHSASPYDETDVDARISATDLVEALTELSLSSGAPPRPTGLVIRKTVIEGNLNLSWLTLDFPLRFDGCIFTGWVTLDHATLRRLELSKCEFAVERKFLSFGAINGSAAALSGGLDLYGIRGLRQLFMPDSELGELTLTPSTIVDLPPAGRFRMVLDGATIERFAVQLGGEKPIPPLGEPSRLAVGSLAGLGSLVTKAPKERATKGKRRRKPEPRTVSVDASALGDWIRAGSTGDPDSTAYSRQVWESFAQALQRDAMEDEATKLRILGRRFGRSKKRWLARAWDSVLDATIGYGYANHRAFVLWLGLLALTTGTTFVASALGWLAYTGEDISSFGAVLLFALTVVLSPIGTGGPSDWFFAGAPVALALVLSAFKIASIVLLGLFIAGLSGIINRR